MHVTLTIFTLLMAVYVWAVLDPAAARSLVAHLKRSWRLYLIERHGDRAAKRLFRRLRQEAHKQGIEMEIVEEAIDKHYDELVWQLGTREANARLGEPTPLERYD